MSSVFVGRRLSCLCGRGRALGEAALDGIRLVLRRARERGFLRSAQSRWPLKTVARHLAQPLQAPGTAVGSAVGCNVRAAVGTAVGRAVGTGREATGLARRTLIAQSGVPTHAWGRRTQMARLRPGLLPVAASAGGAPLRGWLLWRGCTVSAVPTLPRGRATNRVLEILSCSQTFADGHSRPQPRCSRSSSVRV
jgi:hypothetical protein